MSIATLPQWQHVALYAVGAAIVLTLVFRIPFIGRLLRALFSLAILAACLFMLFQQAPFDPRIAKLTERLGLDSQSVAGTEVRIRMSPDGHFWARATIDGVERRMLVDSGATITALSSRTAQRASIDLGQSLVPVMMRTANGTVRAETGRIRLLRLGDIEARDLPVVVTPALGEVDILGMNFLTQLESWRVEGRTLIMVPGKVSGDGRAKPKK
ncbi:TIGR02281 family clan AA aspartic protease [uncultured Sphingomonas sp.]|uniref:retropepsin-like aspartic protease family protein n=1 Tax=uncultured Sphingomonas sp. TaxID=158754 RepID=UPI0035CA67BA